jgi:Spy/CpxP family protein refolding chaperone
MITPLKVAGAAILSIVGGVAGFAVTRPVTSGAAPTREGAAVAVQQPQSQAGVLAQLGLDEMQREQIARLRAREQTRIELLQRALDASERELRLAELAHPFDAKRVNELVANQAELAAYLRGTESRVIAEIAALLTPEQRHRFLSLRANGEAAPSRMPARSAPRPRRPSKGIAVSS